MVIGEGTNDILRTVIALALISGRGTVGQRRPRGPSGHNGTALAVSGAPNRALTGNQDLSPAPETGIRWTAGGP